MLNSIDRMPCKEIQNEGSWFNALNFKYLIWKPRNSTDQMKEPNMFESEWAKTKNEPLIGIIWILLSHISSIHLEDPH